REARVAIEPLTSHFAFRLDRANFGGSALDDLGDAPLLLGGRAAHIEQCRLQRRARTTEHRVVAAASVTMTSVAATPPAIVVFRRLAQALPLQARALDLRDRGVDGLAVLGEMRLPLGGQPVELARPLGLDRGIAGLFEIGERGINDARARHVEAVREVVERLDDLVAVTRLLLQERQYHQLQVLGGQLASAAEAAPLALGIVGKAAGEAAEAVAAMAAMTAAEIIGEPGHEIPEWGNAEEVTMTMH